jgi:EmrB/QacA subfamily drug resistance transporter
VSRITDTNRKWWVLAAVTFSLFMVMLDTTIVNVALPAIQKDFKIGQSKLEWIVNAFLLSYAVLLLPGGKLADYLGRRRFLLIGVAIFTAASLTSGLATSGTMLIASRAVMGVGAGLMMPATHSLISANFSESEHGLAYGVWSGISTLGLALGPLAGGVLVQKASWPWIFYVNVPLGIVAIVLARLVILESKDMSTEQGLDPPGLVVGAVGLLTLIFGITEGQGYGWTSKIILACFICAAVALPLFVLLEAKQRRPMMDLSLFRNSTFTGANIVTMLIMLTMLGILFFVSIYLQNVLGYSAIQTGATFLPLTLIFLLVSPVAGILGDRLGFRWPVASGMALLAAGLYLFSRITVHTTFWALLPALIVGGIGMGVATAPVTAAAMGATPVDKSGVGAGILVTFRQTGGALGVAIMGAIIASKLGHAVPGAKAFPRLFVDGFHDSLLVATAIAFGGAVVAAATIGPVRHIGPARTGAERLAGRLAVGTLAGVPAHTAVRRVVSRAVSAVGSVNAPALLMKDGPLAGQRFAVESELSLGRAGADIMLEDPQVSRRHALVRPVDATFEIADLDSINGTFVNGERITTPRRLVDGDLLRLGHVSIQVELPPAVLVAPTVAAQPLIAVLVVKDGPLAGERFPVESELSLGRVEADITLDDAEVSGRHALARPVDGSVELADAGSVNGTFVNDERIERPRRLVDGDLIRLGRTSLQIEVPAVARAAPTVRAAVSRPPPPPVLIVQDGPLAGERFPVESELSLGRVDADITLDDAEVSRRHALARPVDGSVELADAGSANGTFVNGERIERPRRLVDGDLIRLGRTSLQFEVSRVRETDDASSARGGGYEPSGYRE